MVFVPVVGRRRGRRPPPRAAVFAAIVAAVSAVVANVWTHYGRAGARLRRDSGDDIGSTNTLLLFAAAVALPIVIFIIVKLVRRNDDGSSSCDNANTNEGSDDMSSNDTSDDNRPLAIVIAVMAAVIAILVGMLAWTKDAHAQETADRGALFVRMGADTLVTDRFVRSGDTLTGSMQVKSQQRVDYIAVLGPGNDVRTLVYDVYAPSAKEGDAPATHLRFTMKGDTAVAETPAGIQRVATKPGAIPMMGNMMALTELFTRRARSAGGTLEIPYLVMAGGSTIMVSVRPAGPDTLVMTFGAQEQRLRVDAVGRILGGTVPGRNIQFFRGGAEAAGTLHAAPNTAAAPKPDYSAPPGAPYTAEDVKIRGPAGTLGGTLTKPKSSRGPLPAVVTITGSGQQDRDEFLPLPHGGVRLFRELADTLGRRGIVVLRLDDRGLGESTGDASKATTADFADDIRAGVAYLRSRADIDPNRIALVGHSEGGMIGPMIAAGDPKVRAVVAMGGPAWKGIDISMSQNKQLVDQDKSLSQAKRDSILRQARLALAPERQEVPWLKFFLAYDPAPALKQVKVPVLVVQGATDTQILPVQADSVAALVRSGGNKDVTVRIFPATNHLFVADSSGNSSNKYADLKSTKVRPEVLGAVADWLVRKIGTGMR